MVAADSIRARRPGEHRDLVRPADPGGPSASRPTPGPIAVLPAPIAAIVDAIASAGGTIAELSADTRGLVWLGGSVGELAAVLAENPAIGWVQLPLAGVENVAELFAAQADARLPVWTSAKGAYAEPVAEHAVALTLSLLRQVPSKARSHEWASPREGISLYGRNVTIVGAGGIAIEIMRLMAPFEVVITVVRREALDLAGAARTVTVSGLRDVLPQADVVILAAAATEETSGLLGARELALMKPSAVLVNVARGSLVDQDALVASLRSGHLWGVGLDVTSPEPLEAGHPLWSAPRCVITSHSADTDEMVEPLLARRVSANVAAFLGDGRFVGRVDPAVGY